jgi:hypothetical protein
MVEVPLDPLIPSFPLRGKVCHTLSFRERGRVRGSIVFPLE